ncbi:putative membrane protein [Cnuella takakiae]|uniref:Putative membrane protein n=1 Tax=Cnuella takakiae TaxID=1302690 RepID=A0A1M5B873_9BACT|nr:carotenoid biosynthesis protein [Cnuella takakiae]OLY93372.1 hypothetical protein BUE76_16910 [Cnuella takakiae]SHF38648.1 putative membrane protein [Cnuella takakiae]
MVYVISKRSNPRLLTVGWITLIVYLVWSIGGQQLLAPVLNPFYRNLVEQVLLTLFFVVLALGYYKVKELGVFALLCFVVSNLFENTSVLFGFPFGYFEHSPALGPRLFNIPWLATPTYMAMGFVSWMVAKVLVHRTRFVQWNTLVWETAIVASFVFSMWDFCNDPVFHLNKAFAYRNPGPWFGVPVSNFMGWLLVTFCFYFPISLFLSLRNLEKDYRLLPPKQYWHQALLMYGAVAAGGIYRNSRGKSFVATFANGDQWQSEVIYTSMTLTCLFTMVFVFLLAVIQLNGIREYSSWRRQKSSLLSIDQVM